MYVSVANNNLCLTNLPLRFGLMFFRHIALFPNFVFSLFVTKPLDHNVRIDFGIISSCCKKWK